MACNLEIEMNPIEAMTMAIETINLGALVKCHEAHYVVTKLTEAIEQMEKAEPVAWLDKEYARNVVAEIPLGEDREFWLPLYLHPSQDEAMEK
jgi:hypothetical protein